MRKCWPPKLWLEGLQARKSNLILLHVMDGAYSIRSSPGRRKAEIHGS